MRRWILIGLLAVCVMVIASFFYVRATAPRLSGDPTLHTPDDALVVIDLHVARAIEKSPIGELVKGKLRALPPECGDSPLSYVQRVSLFLRPSLKSNPDWGIVFPHLPEDLDLVACVQSAFEGESVAFKKLGWYALIRMGLRWGGTIDSSEHQFVSPLHGGFVAGEAQTVQAVLAVARGDESPLATKIEGALSSRQLAGLRTGDADELARLVLLPPSDGALRGYWQQRLPGMWPVLSSVLAARGGMSVGDEVRFRASVLAMPESAAAVKSSLQAQLDRLRRLAAFIPGLDLSTLEINTVDDWLHVDFSVPTSLVGTLSKLSDAMP